MLYAYYETFLNLCPLRITVLRNDSNNWPRRQNNLEW